MIATADSSVNRAIWAIISILNMVILIEGPVFPIRVISRCPAIMFAASRIAKVPGRIIFLIVSIHTMNGINTLGVPCGTRWISMWFVFLIHPNSMNPSQRGSAKDRVSTMCLVLVKMYGNNPRKLLNMIMENSEMKMNVLPFLSFLWFKRVLNSLCSFVVIVFHSIV
jgi:hypothetical protein